MMMHIHQGWWVKKNPTLYLLDLAILLAVFRQFNENDQVSLFPRDILQENAAQTLEMGLLPEPFVIPDMVRNYKIKALFEDHNSTVENLSFIRGNATANVTAHMVLVSPLEIEEDISIEQIPFLEPILNVDQDFFHAEDAYRSNNNINQSTNSSQRPDALANTNMFNESDEVRWRQFLNTADDCEAASSHCETNTTKDDDLYSLSNLSKDESFSIGIFNDLNSDHNKFHGCSSSLKVSSDLSSLYHDMFNHSCKNQETSDSAASSSKTLSYSPPHNSLDTEDADLMQMLYEQDVDLGYNWQNNEPVKQLKDPNDVSLMKTDSLNLEDFSVDGETGELIPIVRERSHQQNEVSIISQAPSQLPFGNTTSETSSAALDIDECLEILENSIDDMRPVKPVSQKSIEECNSMVRNLTSFMDVPVNPTVQSNPNSCLWQQIDELSDLTNLNLREERPSITSPTHNDMNGNLNYNNQVVPTAMQQQNINEQFHFAPSNYNTVAQPVNNFEPAMQQSYPMLGYGNNDQSSPLPTSYVSNPITSDDGIPMDTNYAPMNSDKQRSYSSESCNNFNYQIESSSPSAAPVLSSLPEPGQSFFDYLSPEDGVSNYSNASSTAQSFQPQPGAAFLNPPVTNFSPPPLNQAPTSSIFLQEIDQQLSSADKNGMVECYESDSGISLDQSPQGIDFLTLNNADEAVFTNDITSLKTEPGSTDQGFAMPDLKAVQHNHTYNGTPGAVKLTKKKVEKTNHARESRDEKKARDLNLPFTLNEIILSPVEEYNEMLARTPLNPAQQALVKDIRRRGKNKVAAQNCRKRKIETISNMEEDVELMRSKKQQLVDEQKELEIQYESMKLQYSALYRQIFSALRDDAGRPYDPELFRLEQVEGAVFLVPHQRLDGQNTSSNGDIDFSKVKQERS